MSKRIALWNELKALEREGLIEIDAEDETVTILKDNETVKERILQTGPWGALLLLGIPFQDRPGY